MSSTTQGSGGVSRTGEEKTTGKVIAIAVVAAVGGFLFGFDSSVVNGAVEAIAKQFDLGEVLQGFAVSCALLGAAVGAWFAGPLADKYGRTRVMVMAAAIFAVSAVGSGLAFAVWDLILWRTIGGVGIGAASVIAPAYIAEVSPAAIRGRLGSLQQFAITVGILAALISNALLSNLVDGDAAAELWWGLAAWRWMFLVGLVPAVVWAALALAVPESPRYLVAKGRQEEAGRVLASIQGLKDRGTIKRRIAEIAKHLAAEREPSLRDLKGPRLGLKPIVWVGILLSVFQQAVGINVIFYYSTSLWSSVGFAPEQASLFSVVTAITNVLVTLVAIALVDKVGRRPMLLAGSVGMAVSLGVMALSFTQGAVNGDQVSLPAPWGPIALVAANLFIVAFGITWGPVVWVLLGEMFPGRIRAAALAVAAAAQWIANFVISTSFPTLASIGLPVAYGLYTALAVLSFFFVLKAVPETKGRELEDMDDLHVERRARTHA
ncbi:MFS transporter, sugar porter (SP) family [Quadrisphaera granulorum]|uniref:Sugar porter (SP) family MFS transporter n=1 Tax=Quadrisphaera granulorum TaxID=317664 RepID=A0A316ADG5_9ACTN|nr:sugar porter family MFS transporter [Quadrisphaera granulorum]PWJ55816.1 sugar porter (SP) family MFS transporter [Quadrisphaera granulorum]SZE95313.1 MFS transporter, sugar porter (SP) family [Quadrisphaera granulorum]